MKLRFGLILISVLLHAMLFVALPRIRAAKPAVASEPVVVELMSAPTPKASLARSSRTRGAPSSQATIAARDVPSGVTESQTQFEPSSQPSAIRVDPNASSGDLAISPSFRPRSRGTTGANDAQAATDLAPKFDSDGVPTDDPTSPWGSGGGQFVRVRDLAKFDRLYDMIDGQVQYPGVLAYHQIEGTVNARLVLSEKGRCDWHHSKIESTQAHLKLYVLDVLEKVCTRDLKRFARKGESANLDLSFKFAITEYNDEKLIAQQKKVVGNVFLFYRNSQSSIAEWHLGPFRGMFPVPFVALDFAWLQENYDSVMHSRDPLNDFKDHVTNDLSTYKHEDAGGDS